MSGLSPSRCRKRLMRSGLTFGRLEKGEVWRTSAQLPRPFLALAAHDRSRTVRAAASPDALRSMSRDGGLDPVLNVIGIHARMSLLLSVHVSPASLMVATMRRCEPTCTKIGPPESP